jgi:hypothetical protein
MLKQDAQITEDVTLYIDGKQHKVSRAELIRVAAELTGKIETNGPWDDLRGTLANRREMELRRRWIERQAASLIEACSANVIKSDDDNAQSTRRPLPHDLEHAIRLLLAARPDKPGPGRPSSPRVNGPRLRTLRREAGMTQADLLAALRKADHEGAGAFNTKTLQRYERSEPADPSYLGMIAAVLTKTLAHPVTVEDITLF